MLKRLLQYPLSAVPGETGSQLAQLCLPDLDQPPSPGRPMLPHCDTQRFRKTG